MISSLAQSHSAFRDFRLSMFLDTRHANIRRTKIIQLKRAMWSRSTVRCFKFEPDGCLYPFVVLIYPFLHCILLNCSSLGSGLSSNVDKLTGRFLWSALLSNQIIEQDGGAIHWRELRSDFKSKIILLSLFSFSRCYRSGIDQTTWFRMRALPRISATAS